MGGLVEGILSVYVHAYVYTFSLLECTNHNAKLLGFVEGIYICGL